MRIPDKITIKRGRPITALRAWMEAVDGLYGEHLGEERGYGIRNLASDAEIGEQTARYAQRGDQCGAEVARKLKELTGIEEELLRSGGELRREWTVKIPAWVSQRIAARMRVIALKGVGT